MTLVLRLANSSFSLATAPSSVVQTGVKSLGYENSTPHPSPSHSWKLTVPSVVSAVKSGASSPSCSAIAVLLGVVDVDRPLTVPGAGEKVDRADQDCGPAAGGG